MFQGKLLDSRKKILCQENNYFVSPPRINVLGIRSNFCGRLKMYCVGKTTRMSLDLELMYFVDIFHVRSMYLSFSFTNYSTVFFLCRNSNDFFELKSCSFFNFPS